MAGEHQNRGLGRASYHWQSLDRTSAKESYARPAGGRLIHLMADAQPTIHAQVDAL